MLLRLNLCFIIIATIQLALINASEDITPNAWGIARSRQKAKETDSACTASCPEVLPCNCKDDLAATYYRKLVNFLFRNSKRIVDDFDEKYLINIHLQITEAHLKALSEAVDVRDIDAIVSAVLENSRNGLLVEAKEVLFSWYDHLHYSYLRVINSQSLMLVVMVCLFLCSVILMRTLFKLNWVATILLNLACVSLFAKYLDCNRRLEYENIERTKAMNAEPNPCERSTKFFGLWSNYDGQKCTDYMMSIHGHDRQLCDPVDLTTDFFLSLTLKPLSKIMDNVGAFVDSSFNKHGYIKGAIVAIIVIVVMTYWLRGFFAVFVESLRRPRHASNAPGKVFEKSSEPVTNVPSATQPIVKVQINLDARAIGDYVQQIRMDEEKSRAALCATPSLESSVRGIENVADGFEEDLREYKTASDLLPNAVEDTTESSLEEADIEKDVK